MDYYLQEKKEMKLERVKSVEDLILLSESKRSVIMPPSYSKRPWPAAFVVNLSFINVYNALQRGIYIYKPEKK